jgi:hypothetical protein
MEGWVTSGPPGRCSSVTRGSGTSRWAGSRTTTSRASSPITTTGRWTRAAWAALATCTRWRGSRKRDRAEYARNLRAYILRNTERNQSMWEPSQSSPERFIYGSDSQPG